MIFERINHPRIGTGQPSGAGGLNCASTVRGGGGTAFTLLEMMVVIAIIAIVTSLALPAIQRLAKPKAVSAANRQLLDDLALARSIALSSRSAVYMIFVPTNVYLLNTNLLSPSVRPRFNELLAGQYTSYALYSKRSVGDQPGSGQWRPHYLTEWRTLPDNTFIPQYLFENPDAGSPDPLKRRIDFGYANDFHFPTIDSPFPKTTANVNIDLPYIAFTKDGGLEALGGLPVAKEIRIAPAQGSIFTPKNPDGSYVMVLADVLETASIVANGDIVKGMLYQVGARFGTNGVIQYYGTNYPAGATFRGELATPSYTWISGEPFVKPYEGVELNPVTGRGKIVRSEIQ